MSYILFFNTDHPRRLQNFVLYPLLFGHCFLAPDKLLRVFFIQMILLHISIAWYFSIINLGHPWTADIFPYSVTWFILIVSQLILLHISLLSNPRSVDTSPCFCQSSQSAFSCIQARSRKRSLSTRCTHFFIHIYIQGGRSYPDA